MTVTVTDGKADDGRADNAVDDTIAVTINVLNVEEPGTLTLDTDTPRVGSRITGTLTDPDYFVSWTLRWQRSRDRDVDWTRLKIFKINHSSYTPTAEDKCHYLRLTAMYRDEQGGKDWSNQRTLHVTTANPVGFDPSKNRPPCFASMKFMRTVDENSSAGTNTGAPVTAIDKDGDDLTYGLLGPDAGSFTIDTATGQLKVKNALDYETKTSYMVDITVSDGKNATGGVDPKIDDIAWIIINVADVNEN